MTSLNKKLKIAFDIDDTILVPSILSESGDNTPSYEVIAIFKFFQSQGHEMFLWSGSGMDWAQRWGEKFGLQPFAVIKKEKIITLDTDDGQPEPIIDIAFDDCDVDLAKVNVKVSRIKNSVSRKDWNETKRARCPVCNTGVHFAGKIMEYEEGILVENDCRRCGGTGFLS